MSEWVIIHSDELAHYGVGHLNGGHSGRYPWGSGERPYGGTVTRAIRKIRTDAAERKAAKAEEKAEYQKKLDDANKRVAKANQKIAKSQASLAKANAKVSEENVNAELQRQYKAQLDRRLSELTYDKTTNPYVEAPKQHSVSDTVLSMALRGSSDDEIRAYINSNVKSVSSQQTSTGNAPQNNQNGAPKNNQQNNQQNNNQPQKSKLDKAVDTVNKIDKYYSAAKKAAGLAAAAAVIVGMKDKKITQNLQNFTKGQFSVVNGKKETKQPEVKEATKAPDKNEKKADVGGAIASLFKKEASSPSNITELANLVSTRGKLENTSDSAAKGIKNTASSVIKLATEKVVKDSIVDDLKDLGLGGDKEATKWYNENRSWINNMLDKTLDELWVDG